MFPIVRFRVDDRSMEPTLNPGDYVLVNRWSYKSGEPARGDLVVVRDPQQPARFLVKRISDVTNGGSCFLAGDNVEFSRDSRAFGPVPKDLVVGRVWKAAKP